MDDILKKGQFVLHPTKIDEWGDGILTEDQTGDGKIKVLVENECMVVELTLIHI